MLSIFVMCVIAQTSGHLYFHMAQSVSEAVTQYVTPGNTMVVSYSTPAHTTNIAHDNSVHNRVIYPSRNTNNTVREYVFGDLQSSEDLMQMILAQLNKMEKWSLLSLDANDDFKQTLTGWNKREGYVLLSSSHDLEDVMQEIRQQVKKLRDDWAWNPRAKFIILLSGIQYKDTKFVAQDILAELWTTKVVDVVVLIPTPDTQTATESVNVLDAYVWFPYQPMSKCGHVIDAVLQNRWVLNSNNIGHFLHNTSLFPQKIFRNLHGCPLTISTFEVPPCTIRKKNIEADEGYIYDRGVEIKALTEFAKSLNSSLKFREPPPDGGNWGWDIGNGTWNGVTGEIVRGYSDVGAALLWHRCHMLKEMECLRPHLIDKVRWFVPCARPYPRWMSLTRVFKLSLWLGVVIAYVIISVVMWRIVKVTSNISTESAENQAYSSLGKCLLNFWAIILEESASNNPPNVAGIRSVFFAWVLYCWAVNNVYQAYLTSFLIDPGLQHQLATEEEMFTSGIDYSTERSLIFLYPMLTSESYDHMIVYNSVATGEEKVDKGLVTFLFSMTIVNYDIAVNYMDADGNPTICYMEDDFGFTLASMFVPKGYPFKAWFDTMLLKFLQAGLINFWWEEIKYAATLEKSGDFNLPPGEYIALTMEHLQSAFYFLLLGSALSVVSFLLEITCHYRKRYENKKDKN